MGSWKEKRGNKGPQRVDGESSGPPKKLTITSIID